MSQDEAIHILVGLALGDINTVHHLLQLPKQWQQMLYYGFKMNLTPQMEYKCIINKNVANLARLLGIPSGGSYVDEFPWVIALPRLLFFSRYGYP